MGFADTTVCRSHRLVKTEIPSQSQVQFNIYQPSSPTRYTHLGWRSRPLAYTMLGVKAWITTLLLGEAHQVLSFHYLPGVLEADIKIQSPGICSQGVDLCLSLVSSPKAITVAMNYYNFLIVYLVTFGSLTYGYNSAIIGSVIGLPSFFDYFHINEKTSAGSRITGGEHLQAVSDSEKESLHNNVRTGADRHL